MSSADEVGGLFLLPRALAFAVAPGLHGSSVAVAPGGLVELTGRTREHVVRRAAAFFALVAQDRIPFSVAAVIGDRASPGGRDTYQLTVVDGYLIAARCALAPLILPLGGDAPLCQRSRH